MADKASKMQELRSAFDAYNVNRVYLATLNFSENEENFFRAVPVLLHCAVDVLGCPSTAPHGICSFNPQSLHLEAFNHLFPESKLLETKSTNYTIHMLSLMGSLGTVAQTEKSDFDYVALINKKKLSEKELAELNQKIFIIEKWAMDKLSIEVHFFLQDIVDFRENRFGLTDEESAGSAGGKLLKDEFYRTAIIISGKRPMWWITPTGMPEEKFKDFKKELPLLIGDKAKDYLDIGHILHIEPEEFYGAALWHMSKFLKSPYKSLLKMALLESYIFNPEDSLLCEKLKTLILKPGKDRRIPDPYVMMCERVINDYLIKGVPENEIRIVQAALLLKTGVTSEDLKELLSKSDTDLSDKQSVISNLLKQWNWSASDLNLLSENILGRDNKFLLSEKVSGFLLNAYKRVSDRLQQSGIKSNLISKEDLTVLGRKLFTFFDKNPGKIPFVLPGQTPKEPPECITIVFDTLSGKEPKWRLFDFHLYGTESHDLRSISRPVASFSSLPEVLVWTVINQFWKPGSKTIFESKNSHLKQKDMEKVITELFAFLADGSHKPVREDYLSKKRIIKALVIVNFGTKNSPNKLSDIDLVLLNSWGEFFINCLEPDQASEETADMIVFAKLKKKLFKMKIIAPLYKSDSKLCKKFENSVNMLVEYKIDENEMKKKKPKLDTFT